MQLQELQMLNELMRTGILDKANFSTALQDRIEEKIIDYDSFRRIGQLLEEHFDEPKEEQPQKIMVTA